MTTRSTIEEREQEIIEDFELFEDWMGKYEFLIDLGKSLPPLDEAYRTEENKIHGCQSRVWVFAEYKDGLVSFQGDSDALITKGLVALLIRVLSAQPPEAIASSELSFLDQIGMKEHLSPNRKNGLASMIQQMKLYALAFTTSIAERM